MANNVGIKVGLSLDTTQGTKEFNDWSNRTRAQLQKHPIKVNLQIDGQAYEKKIETFINANRELAQVTTYTNKATGEQYAQVTKTASAFEQCASAEQQLVNVNKNLSNSQHNLNTHTKQSISLFKDFTATFMKMAKFNTINMIYDGIINKMSEAIQITNDFDAAMTEFNEVTDTTTLRLNDYTEQLGQLGEATARTTTQMLQSATEFSKAGFTPENSARLAQVASLYQNIADAEVSAGEAASFITSQIKAFKDYGVEANNAITIIDKINEVSYNFAVSKYGIID